MFLDFPFYKFSPAAKPTWKSRFFKMLLYLFILYLACNALLERNRRLRKTVHDFLHDHEVVYHQMRLMRFLVLPVFKLYDLSKFHTTHCIVQNPFKLQGRFLFVTIFIAKVTCKTSNNYVQGSQYSAKTWKTWDASQNLLRGNCVKYLTGF